MNAFDIKKVTTATACQNHAARLPGLSDLSPVVRITCSKSFDGDGPKIGQEFHAWRIFDEQGRIPHSVQLQEATGWWSLENFS